MSSKISEIEIERREEEDMKKAAAKVARIKKEAARIAAKEAARIAAEEKEKAKTTIPQKKHEVVKRRILSKEDDEYWSGDSGDSGDVYPLWKIVEGPPTRTTTNENPHNKNYTVITRYLFNYRGTREFKTMFLIPKDAEVVLMPENKDVSAYYSVRVGDAFVYISTKFGEVKPGMLIEGWAELSVKKVKKPNIGPRSGLYPYVNIRRLLEDSQRPEFILEFDSEKRFVENGSFAFTPASGRSRTVLHMSRTNEK